MTVAAQQWPSGTGNEKALLRWWLCQMRRDAPMIDHNAKWSKRETAIVVRMHFASDGWGWQLPASHRRWMLRHASVANPCSLISNRRALTELVRGSDRRRHEQRGLINSERKLLGAKRAREKIRRSVKHWKNLQSQQPREKTRNPVVRRRGPSRHQAARRGMLTSFGVKSLGSRGRFTCTTPNRFSFHLTSAPRAVGLLRCPPCFN